MAFGVGEAIGLIGLLAALASAGASAGEGASSSKEQSLIDLRNKDIQRDKDKQREKEEQAARRAALARAIGSRTTMFEPDQKISEPYKPNVSSGWDIAAGVANTAGSLASTASQQMNSDDISSGVDVTGKEASGFFEGGGVDTTGPTGDSLAKRPQVDVDPNQPYSRYGSYAKRRYS